MEKALPSPHPTPPPPSLSSYLPKVIFKNTQDLPLEKSPIRTAASGASVIQKDSYRYFLGSAVLKQPDDQRGSRINRTSPETCECSARQGSFKGKNEPPCTAPRTLTPSWKPPSPALRWGGVGSSCRCSAHTPLTHSTSQPVISGVPWNTLFLHFSPWQSHWSHPQLMWTRSLDKFSLIMAVLNSSSVYNQNCNRQI